MFWFFFKVEMPSRALTLVHYLIMSRSQTDFPLRVGKWERVSVWELDYDEMRDFASSWKLFAYSTGVFSKF